MLQLIFVIPIIYFIVKRYDFFGAVFCLIITAMWEMTQYSWGMDRFSYALLVFRYVSIIAFGCYIAVGKRKLNKTVLVAMFIIGVIWQTLLNYVPLHPIFMNYDWARVNYLPSLFVMPIMYVLIKRFCGRNISCIPLQEFGKASFNIFLVQMVFYGCGPANIIYKYITQTWIQLLICLSINLIGGYIFYRIENKVTSWIINKVRERNYYSDVMLRISVSTQT